MTASDSLPPHLPADLAAAKAPATTAEPKAPGSALAALEARLRQDLAWLDLPAKPWMAPRSHDGRPVLDVAVIGAGMAGMAAAATLRHLGIRATLFDRAPAGFEGPWATTARMETLRSPKQLTGPALGLPALTFRAWFEAQFGTEAWDALDKIPRLQWMDYLRWYRQVMDLDVRNGQRIERVVPRADGLVSLTVSSETDGQSSDVLARRVVLATGRDGLGGPYVPPVAAGVPRHLWAHSSDPFDYASLRGKRVGVVGAGASAMDSAATALEAGAAHVAMLIRRAEMPRVNKSKGSGNPGLTHGHYGLPDAWKWRLRQYINSEQVPPPRGSTQRVSRHSNASFHFGCPIERIEARGDVLRVTTPRGELELDFLVFSTGFRIDLAGRPEFASFGADVRLWGDRFCAPDGQQDAELHDSPDLGPAFEFQARDPGRSPGLSRIHCFCYPAALSHGTISGDIPAISDGAKRLGQGIAALFYQEDVETHFANLEAYSEPELLGDEWTASAAFDPALVPAGD